MIALIPARSAQASRTVAVLVIAISVLGIGYGVYQYFQGSPDGSHETEEEMESMLQLFLILLGPGALVAFVRLLLVKPDRL